MVALFISNWKKHKCRGISEHLKDPKNILDLTGLREPFANIMLVLNYVVWTLRLLRTLHKN